jgi:hypothetical protein
MQPVPPSGQPPYPPPYPYMQPPPPRSSGSSAIVIVAIVLGAVVVVGILAAVAIPAFLGTMKKAKHSEAELNLDAIYKGMKMYVAENGKLPASAPLTPAEPCCEQPGHRCQPDYAQWSTPGWEDIDFEIDTPSSYQYAYTVDGDTVVMNAVGDLDCDGESSTYTLTAHLVGGSLMKDQLVAPSHVD